MQIGHCRRQNVDWSPSVENRLIIGIEMQIHSPMRGKKMMYRNQLMLMESCMVVVPVTAMTSLFSTASTKGFFPNLCVPKGLKNTKVLCLKNIKGNRYCPQNLSSPKT